jgi:hypothetical protein
MAKELKSSHQQMLSKPSFKTELRMYGKRLLQAEEVTIARKATSPHRVRRGK